MTSLRDLRVTQSQIENRKSQMECAIAPRLVDVIVKRYERSRIMTNSDLPQLPELVLVTPEGVTQTGWRTFDSGLSTLDSRLLARTA